MPAKTHTILAAAAFATGLLAAAPAGAAAIDSQIDTVTRQVSIEGLDLSSPSEQAKLNRRVAVAARHVCMDLMVNEPLQSDRFTNCVSTAQTGATPQVQARIAQAQARSLVASIKP